MTPGQLAALKLQHDAYIDRAVQRGRTAVTYTVPCCGSQQTGLAQPPDENDQWDTMAVCTDCGAAYMKITKGAVITALVPPRE